MVFTSGASEEILGNSVTGPCVFAFELLLINLVFFDANEIAPTFTLSCPKQNRRLLRMKPKFCKC